MLEVIKELGLVIKDLPDMAIWILTGILFYKVFVLGSILSLVKYAITKFHEFLVKPKVITKEVDISGHFISTDTTFSDFMEVIQTVKRYRVRIDSGRIYSRDYLDNSDIAWLLNAVTETKEKELSDAK